MADFWTSITVKGTENELLALLKIVRIYVVEKQKQGNCPYLESATVNGSNGLSDDELLSIIKSAGGQINIQASGPYGSFVFLEEVELFREMADAAPCACFEGEMSGFNLAGDQAEIAVLENGILTISDRYPKDEMWSDFDDDMDDDGDDEYDEGDEEEWDSVSCYLPIPAVSDPALYVVDKININNSNKDNVEFAKHNFAVSNSCIEKTAIMKAIESRGGKIRKFVGKTTHYVIIGKNVNGFDVDALQAICLNTQEGKSIVAIAEEEFLASMK